MIFDVDLPKENNYLGVGDHNVYIYNVEDFPMGEMNPKTGITSKPFVKFTFKGKNESISIQRVTCGATWLINQIFAAAGFPPGRNDTMNLIGKSIKIKLKSQMYNGNEYIRLQGAVKLTSEEIQEMQEQNVDKEILNDLKTISDLEFSNAPTPDPF